MGGKNNALIVTTRPGAGKRNSSAGNVPV